MNARPLIASLTSLEGRFYRLFWAGALSDVGSFTTHTALVLHVYHLSGQNAAVMGVAAIANLAPLALIAPLGGVWAEKYDRRRIMIANDLARAPLVLLMMTTDSILALLALQSLLSASTAIFLPSRNAIIPELVGREGIHLANSLNGGAMSLLHVLGPVAGATLYAATRTLRWIVLIDGATYLASAALLGAMAYRRDPSARRSHAPFLKEAYAGFRYALAEPDLRYFLLVLTTSSTAIGLLIPLLRPFVGHTLGGDDRAYGYLIAAFGLGGVVGPVTGYWAGKKLGLGRTISAAFAIEAGLMIAWSRTENFIASCAILFFWGINVFTLIPCYLSYLHTYARKDYLGRTFALFDQASFAPEVLGAALVVALGANVPAQPLLTWAGVIYLAIVATTFWTSGARVLRSRRGVAGFRPGVGVLPGPREAEGAKPDALPVGEAL